MSAELLSRGQLMYRVLKVASVHPCQRVNFPLSNFVSAVNVFIPAEKYLSSPKSHVAAQVRRCNLPRTHACTVRRFKEAEQRRSPGICCFVIRTK